MELVFVTNNKHKLEEVQKIIPSEIKLLTLKDIGFSGEIPETKPTIKENSFDKAKYIYDRYHLDCFADDTGLEVEALDGAPGVNSARFASDHDFEKNMYKVLELMEGKTNRRARFVTVITLFWQGKVYFFEGIVNGVIPNEPRGSHGFGYDPIFQPDGFDETFAQMPITVKNQISHRAIAVRRLAEFLATQV